MGCERPRIIAPGQIEGGTGGHSVRNPEKTGETEILGILKGPPCSQTLARHMAFNRSLSALSFTVAAAAVGSKTSLA